MSIPILLIGGLNCSARMYQHQIPVLWRYGPVMVCDHRSADSVEALASAILESAPPRFAIVGHSMGGFIGLEILRRCADRVHSLALLSSSARPSSDQETLIREQRVAIAKAGRTAEIPPLHYAKNVHPSRQSDDQLRAIHRTMTEEVGTLGYLNQQQAIGTRPDARPGLASIKCPTLVLVGDADSITPPEHAEEMAREIPGSRLVVIPECGHLSTLEKPELVNAALQAWCETSR
jgi:pimeloyl-ACP methyl ester carboxylesterase